MARKTKQPPAPEPITVDVQSLTKAAMKPDSVPTWTHEDLSRMFWHHHSWSYRMAALALSFGVVTVVLSFAGLTAIGYAALLADLVSLAFFMWHRASMRMLGKIRFPSGGDAK